jgi:hypothetical protein
MQTLVARMVLALAGLLASALTRVRLPVLGPTPVLGLVALAVVLAIAAAVLVLVRNGWRDGWLRPRAVTS